MTDRRPVRTAIVAIVVAVAVAAGLALHVEIVVLLLGMIAVAAVLVASLRLAAQHARLSRRLRRAAVPARLSGVMVEVVPGIAPMVAGLVRPAVFCGEHMGTHLEPGEQRAVLLHERGHQHFHDPVRLVVVEAVQRCFGGIRPIREAMVRARARLEVRADAYALARGASRGDLARALLQLSDVAPPTAAGFATITDERIRALVGEEPSPTRTGLRWGVVVAAVATGVFLASMLSTEHPELAWIARCVSAGCVPGS